MTLTPDAVLALAPDEASVHAATAMATPRRWVTLGADEAAVWGEIRGGDLYRVAVLIGEPAFRCTCPSPKKPCKHALALLLAWARAPAAFAPGVPPAWLVEWAEQRAKPARAARAGESSVVDPRAQQRRAAEREARIAGGLEDLDRWLRDLIRQGLAAVQGRGYDLWDAPAARLVDAQAPGVARRLRALAAVAASGTGWPERLLERLGLVFLLVEAYRRQAQLPEDLRADVRSLVGWTVGQDELVAGPGVADRWLVLGERVEEDERYKSQRLWLVGLHGKRPALLLSFGPPGTYFDRSLRPGTILDGELVFFPGATPIRALVKTRNHVEPATGEPPGHATILEAQADYAAALARNPWLDEHPVVLRAVVPQRLRDGWVLRDATDRFVPLARRYGDEKRLAAVAGGRPITAFGEWNGHAILPLAAFVEGRHVAL